MAWCKAQMTFQIHRTSDVLSCFEAGKTAQITRKKQERQGATPTARHRGGKIKEDQTALKPTCQKRKQSHILCASRFFHLCLAKTGVT